MCYTVYAESLLLIFMGDDKKIMNYSISALQMQFAHLKTLARYYDQ